MSTSERYAAADLQRFVAGVLLRFGASDADAERGAAALIDADLSGIDTHGLFHFPTHLQYAPGLISGDVVAKPAITVVRETPSTLVWDAGRTFGTIAAHYAIEAVVERAERQGSATLVWRNGCHFGAIGHFARLAASRGCMALVVCNMVPAAVAPGGRDRVVGTNPFSFAAPIPGRHPFAIDFATTATAGSRIMIARERGESIPLGWAVDGDGRPTTDPHAVREGGTLPLGSGEGNGYKGFGLGLMVDFLAGLLSGGGSGAFQRYVPGYGQGAFFGVWKVDHFVDQGAYDGEATRLVELITGSRPAVDHGPVTLPGDRSADARRVRGRDGIPLDPSVVARNRTLGAQLGIEFPAPVSDADG